MTTRYRFDPEHSRFTVRAFATGLLSFLGHSPTFAARTFAGAVEFEDDLIAKMRLELTVEAGSLVAVGDVPGPARGEMEDRMRAEVLETGRFPEIAFRAAARSAERLTPGRYRMELDGTLTLHGVARPHRVAGELVMFGDGLHLRGDATVRMSDFGIRPVTALGGAIRLRDDVTLSFDVAGVPEAT